MNKYQKALNNVLCYISATEGLPVFLKKAEKLKIDESIVLLQGLIDKEMPKKPNWVTVYNDDDVPAYDILTCPACGFNVEEDIKLNFLLKRCLYCGQSLKTKEIIFTEYRKMCCLTLNEIVNKCKNCDDCSKCEIKELCNIEFCNLNREILNKKVRVNND